MKATPTKWRLKFFVLVDNDGYTIDFVLYTGRSSMSSGKGLSFDAVTALVKKEYLGSGYIVQFLHKSSPLHTPEPAGVRSLWDLQAGTSRSPQHTRECPH